MKMNRRQRKALRDLVSAHPDLRYISHYEWQVPDGWWRWDSDAPGGVLLLRDQLHAATGGNEVQKHLVDYYLMRANKSLDAVGHYERALWWPDPSAGIPIGYVGLWQTRSFETVPDVEQHVHDLERLPLTDTEEAAGVEMTVSTTQRGEATLVTTVERLEDKKDGDMLAACSLDVVFPDCIDTLRFDACCWEIDRADEFGNEILPTMAASAGVVLTTARGMIA